MNQIYSFKGSYSFEHILDIQNLININPINSPRSIINIIYSFININYN
jgi:hypothetical protein